jgi:hypothetical protein
MLDPAKRGMLSPGAKIIRHYTIDLSGGLIFNYAVDTCWAMPQGAPPYEIPDDFPPEANRPEAYRIVVTELDNSLYYEEPSGDAGGELRLLVDVWDHYESALNQVSAESLAGIPHTVATTPIGGGEGYSTYKFEFAGAELIKNGHAELLLSVQSEAVGYDGTLPGKPVTAYFKHPFKIKDDSTAIGGAAWTWGGVEDDFGQGVVIDLEGNLYIAGHFQETVDFDPGPGTNIHSSVGYADIFLSKFDSGGNFQWTKTWGGKEWDGGYGVAIEGSSYIYVTGFFESTVDFDPGPEVDERTSINWSRDIFLSKFDSSGDLQWARTWGGKGYDQGLGVAVDISGNLCVTGCFCSTVDFDPGPGVDEHTANGVLDIFLSKFDSSGEFQWARAWGGSGYYDMGFGVVIDVSGNAYITGYFDDTADFDPGPAVDEHSSNGCEDVFLSKFDPSGEFQWAQTWGGDLGDYGLGVATDESGNAYITGVFGDIVDFDPGAGVDEHTSNGWEDVFLSKFGSNGVFQWAHTWGGSSDDYGYGVAIDGSGNTYVTGCFRDIVDFDPGSGVDEHIYNGWYDIFLSRFDSNGDFHWAQTWGGSDVDEGRGITIDGNGNAFITGSFEETIDFDPGPGIDEHISNGWCDIFLSKFPPDGDW